MFECEINMFKKNCFAVAFPNDDKYWDNMSRAQIYQIPSFWQIYIMAILMVTTKYEKKYIYILLPSGTTTDGGLILN